MVGFDDDDPDQATVLVNFGGSDSAYSDDLSSTAFSHDNGLVATSRYTKVPALETSPPPERNGARWTVSVTDMFAIC